jgi:nitrate reductase gamma subunit
MILSLFAVVVLMLLPAAGIWLADLRWLFGIGVPYAAFLLFLSGFFWRMLTWASSPVPFHIPTVCGQQKSLPWIEWNRTESPWSSWGVAVRVACEVVFFRSLFRNDRTELKGANSLVSGSFRYLWLGGLLFHWALAIILFRHLRFFTEPVLPGIDLIQTLDGLFQLGTPTLYLTDIAIFVSLSYLLFRRMRKGQVRHISLPQDYFALFLLGTIVITGLLLRLFFHPDLVAVKEVVMGVVRLRPALPSTVSLLAYIHLFLVCVLLAYFPFSKLMHGPGIFLSPTRNQRNNSRAELHVNPWDYPVKVHTYEEYEEEFGEAMREAGLPVDRKVETGKK